MLKSDLAFLALSPSWGPAISWLQGRNRWNHRFFSDVTIAKGFGFLEEFPYNALVAWGGGWGILARTIVFLGEHLLGSSLGAWIKDIHVINKEGTLGTRAPRWFDVMGLAALSVLAGGFYHHLVVNAGWHPLGAMAAAGFVHGWIWNGWLAPWLGWALGMGRASRATWHVHRRMASKVFYEPVGYLIEYLRWYRKSIIGFHSQQASLDRLLALTDYAANLSAILDGDSSNPHGLVVPESPAALRLWDDFQADLEDLRRNPQATELAALLSTVSLRTESSVLHTRLISLALFMLEKVYEGLGDVITVEVLDRLPHVRSLRERLGGHSNMHQRLIVDEIHFELVRADFFPGIGAIKPVTQSAIRKLQQVLLALSSVAFQRPFQAAA